MNIAIDISSLQGAHRMRGIGYTLINLINNIPSDQRKNNRFVLYAFPFDENSSDSPLKLLDLTGMNYEVRYLGPKPRSEKRLRGRLNLLVSAYNQLLDIRDIYFGDSRIKNLDDVDIFLQTDQSQSLPRKRGVKKALVVYDIIPLVLEWDYLWSYSTARKIYGFSRKASLRCQARRSLFSFKLRANIRRANTLLAISEITRQDFIKEMKASPQNIFVTPLGVSQPEEHEEQQKDFHRYLPTSWGYEPRPFKIDTSTPFILFVGGADKRRKLVDLLTAFNQVRAQGVELKLVLAGDSMRGPENIATEEIQTALKQCSYIDDVVFLGFVNDVERSWLYKHALAFVFPSRYEGFGLPVLEAMAHGCLVISYKNLATLEVAGDAPIYADSSEGLRSSLLELLGASKSHLETMRQASLEQANKYDWVKTSRHIIDILDQLT